MKKLLIGLALTFSLTAGAISGDYLGQTNKGTFIYQASLENNVNCIREYKDIEQTELENEYCADNENGHLFPGMAFQGKKPWLLEKKCEELTTIGPTVSYLGFSHAKKDILNKYVKSRQYRIQEKDNTTHCLNITSETEHDDTSHLGNGVVQGIVKWLTIDLLISPALHPILTLSGCRHFPVKKVCWEINK